MRIHLLAFAMLLFIGIPAQAQQSQPSSASPVPTGIWAVDWTITHGVNAIGGAFAESTSHALSTSLFPVGVATPSIMFAGAHWQWFSNDQTSNRYLAETAVLTVLAEAGTVALVVGLKSVVSRERPYVAYPDRIAKRESEILSSFPSGHAAVSASVATMLSLRYPKWYVIVPSALWSVGMSLSRMHLGVHYFTDVLAGTAIGAGVALLVYSLRADIAPNLEFLLPSPDTVQKSTTMLTNAAPVGIGITPDGGVGIGMSIPLGL